MGPEIGYEAIGLVDSELPTEAVFAKASSADTPAAVATKTGESLRSETEQNEVSLLNFVRSGTEHWCITMATYCNSFI